MLPNCSLGTAPETLLQLCQRMALAHLTPVRDGLLLAFCQVEFSVKLSERLHDLHETTVCRARFLWAVSWRSLRGS